MSNKKSIDDKVLLRAIADIVVQNPSYAQEVFGNMSEIVKHFPELKVISDFILNIPSIDPNIDSNEPLINAINKIPDTETRNIFLLSANSKKT